MTLFRLTLRAHRTGLIATALLGAVTGLLNAVAYAQIAGNTPLERALFAQQMELLARQLSYLLPNPVQLDTMAGYLVWRAFGVIAIVYAFWGLLAGTGAGRGDEERGLVELWLATGVSRVRWAVTRAVGFFVIAAVSLAVTFGATEIGTVAVNDALPVGPLALQGLAMWALTIAAYGFGLLASQQPTTRRAASTMGGALLLVLFLVNSAGRSGLDLGALRWASPFYLYERSAPPLRGGSLDVGATLALILLAVALVALSAIAFSRRDLGGQVIRFAVGRTRPTTRPSGDPLLRVPVLAIVDQQRLWVAGWAIGLAALAAFLTSLTRTIVDSLANANIPLMRAYFQRAGIAAYSDFVGVIWFTTLLLLVSIFVIVQVNSWAADDAEGRLEAILSAPVSRTRVVLERIGAVLIAAAVVVSCSSVGVYLAANANEISLSTGRFVVASADVIPVAYAFAGIGHALVGWRPRIAVVALGAVAAISYLTQQFAPLFEWPDWVKNTSLYALYGTPLSNDDWPGIATLVAIGIAGTAIALVVMRRRDVGR
ncbi:MAG TPA: ABC transporter permease subunit [Candidatus Limnocylindria bacterium]|nr:ABC transporter permease subunit [Candidatus Limnocylindria bacterium]